MPPVFAGQISSATDTAILSTPGSLLLTMAFQIIQKDGLITTDSVFSMDGDIAPIDKLDQLAKESEFVLLIDDAHGFGVLGQGKGSYAHFGLKPERHRLMLGTLGKALGSFGGFYCGRCDLH